MLAQVDEERGQVAAQRLRHVVDGEDSKWQPRVPVVLASVGEGAERVAEHPVNPLGLGVGVLAVGLPDQEARADAPRELPEQLAREFGIVVHDEHVRDAVPGAECHLQDDLRRICRSVGRARGHSVDLAREVINVHLDLIEARRRRGQAQEPVDTKHSAGVRPAATGGGGDGAGRAG